MWPYRVVPLWQHFSWFQMNGRLFFLRDLTSTLALFVAPRTPIFPGFSRMVARLFAHPRGPVGFQELKNAPFFQAFLVARDYKMGKSRACLRWMTAAVPTSTNSEASFPISSSRSPLQHDRVAPQRVSRRILADQARHPDDRSRIPLGELAAGYGGLGGRRFLKSSADACSPAFHSQFRAPFDPPPSASISQTLGL